MFYYGAVKKNLLISQLLTSLSFYLFSFILTNKTFDALLSTTKHYKYRFDYNKIDKEAILFEKFRLIKKTEFVSTWPMLLHFKLTVPPNNYSNQFYDLQHQLRLSQSKRNKCYFIGLPPAMIIIQNHYFHLGLLIKV